MEIRQIHRNDVDTLSAMLSQSFFGDRLYTHFAPDDVQRQQFLFDFFRFRLRFARKHGEVYLTDDRHGVAVWLPPGAQITPWRFLRFGGLKAVKLLDEGRREQFEEFAAWSGKIEETYAPGNHWHLSPVAVHPSWWNQGYASQLIRAKLPDVDAEGAPCFLETQSIRGVEIYKRYGFQVVGRETIPSTRLPHYLMVRPPRKG